MGKDYRFWKGGQSNKNRIEQNRLNPKGLGGFALSMSILKV